MLPPCRGARARGHDARRDIHGLFVVAHQHLAQALHAAVALDFLHARCTREGVEVGDEVDDDEQGGVSFRRVVDGAEME
jgi:hypothetical protein